eukprot:4567297-Pyramimonas_sp.AAC.1
MHVNISSRFGFKCFIVMPPTAQAIVSDIIPFVESRRLRRCLVLGAFSISNVASIALVVTDEASSTGAERRREHSRMRQAIRSALGSFGSGSSNQVPLELLHKCLNATCATQLGPEHIDMVRRRLVDADDGAAVACIVPAVQDGHGQCRLETSIAECLSDKYGDKSRDELQLALLDKDIEIARLRDDCHKISASRNYYKQKSENWSHVLKGHELQIKSLNEQIFMRPGKRNVSVFGGYSIALKRNIGHTSSKAIVAVLSGDPERGGLRDKNISIKFEHRCNHVQRLLSSQHYQAIAVEFKTCLRTSGTPPPFNIEVIQYLADATNQSAIQKEKMHIALVSCLSASSNALACTGTAEYLYTRSLADIQCVRTGTGDELLALALREFASVYCPDWRCRKENTISTFMFGLDKGPDCQKFGRLVVAEMQSVPNVIVHVQWCSLHSYHKIVEKNLEFADSFTWPGYELPVKYTSALKTLVNTWRAPGMHRKLKAAATKLFNPVLAHRIFKILPGRCISGRWCSVDAVEKRLVHDWVHIASVFAKVLKGAKIVDEAACVLNLP